MNFQKSLVEFTNFVNQINIDKLSDEEKKFINLIIDNFEKIAETGTAQGKRAKLLVELIRDQGKTISITIKKNVEDSGKSSLPFKSIKSLEIEEFRGFNRN